MTKPFGCIVAALVVTLCPASAFAQNNTCATFLRMAVDDVKETYFQDATANAERWFGFIMQGHRSYCVETVGADFEMKLADTYLTMYAQNCTTVLGTSDDNQNDPALWRGSRLCFVGPAASDFRFARVTSCCPGGTAPTATYFDIRITETTLFSPYYQVALASGYDAAPQIRNNTSETIDVAFTTYNAAGAAIGCISTPIAIPANGMTTFGVSSTCSINPGFGSASIAHNGPPGAISANITTFSGVSGLSFDAEFEVREKNIPSN